MIEKKLEALLGRVSEIDAVLIFNKMGKKSKDSPNGGVNEDDTKLSGDILCTKSVPDKLGDSHDEGHEGFESEKTRVV